MKYGNDVKYVCEIQGKAEIEEKSGEPKNIDVVLKEPILKMRTEI